MRDHLRLNCELRSATWLEGEGRWALETTDGEVRAGRGGRHGPFAEPRIPELPGLERFGGAAFHSARWDHDFDVTGRLYGRVPALQRLARCGVYAGREVLVLGFVKRPPLVKVVERIARRHMASQVDDPDLRERVTPDYTIGCKRILPSNRWYEALAQPNVELVTDGVAEVRARSIVDGAGVEREVDAIVFGTGFRVAAVPAADRVRGRGGQLLSELWRGSPRAHLGTTVAGFPNLFFLLGPNTGLGHSSMVYMIESQIAHVLRALELMDARAADTIEVRPEVQERFNAALERRLVNTVWNTGGASWYLDPAEYLLRTAS